MGEEKEESILDKRVLYADYFSSEVYEGYIEFGLGYEEEDSITIYQRYALRPIGVKRLIEHLQKVLSMYEEKYGAVEAVEEAPPTPPPTPPPQPTPPQPTPTRRRGRRKKAKICPNCGHENKPTARFCVQCGTPLE